MKISDVRELPDSELKHKLRELGREFWKARFDNFSNRLDNTSRLGDLRRTVARIKTVLGERQRARKTEQAS